jgi:hypothetical protein
MFIFEFLLTLYLVSAVLTTLFIIKYSVTLHEVVKTWLNVNIKNKHVVASKITYIGLILYMILFPILNTYLAVMYLKIRKEELLS